MAKLIHINFKGEEASKEKTTIKIADQILEDNIKKGWEQYGA